MKRVLIITYYWPPSGGPGVQRWLQFVKYFKEFGIEPVVYVPENPHYPILDSSFSSEVPVDIEVLKHKIIEPYRFAGLLSKRKTKQISSGIITSKKSSFIEKLLLFIRGNFFIPDARVGWVKPSVQFLQNYISKNPVEVIITSGPPHSLHLIGMQLKEALNLKWIADFRDPWTTIHYHKSLRLIAGSEKKHRQLESKVLNEANIVIVTSPTTKKEFELITTRPVKVITNGFAQSEIKKPTLDSSFSIAHIGSLLSDRNPNIFWKILSEIIVEIPSFKKDLMIKFAGVISDEVIESLMKYGLSENYSIIGYVLHSEALQLQKSAQVLLLVEIDSRETRSIIPGKLFEYLAARRPIIGLGPIGSDFEGIIKETKSGKFFNYDQKEELKKYILDLYNQYKSAGINISSEGIEKYSRRELTRQMVGHINNL